MASEAKGLVETPSPEVKGRRGIKKGLYLLPSAFTAANVGMGYFAVMAALRGFQMLDGVALGDPLEGLTAQKVAAATMHFDNASRAIGWAILFDTLDGRIARLTKTTTEIGIQFDSIADVLTFGIAPAVLGFAWGVQFASASTLQFLREHLLNIGYFIVFLFLLCGAARLARFNVTTNPVPKNPGRPDRKYFVGLPIPAAAGMVAAVVYASYSTPVTWWFFSVLWLALLGLLAFLMVSTWRYRSFKDLSLLRPRSPLTVILVASLIYLVIFYSRPMFLTMGILYIGSGIVVRIGGIVRRRFRRPEAHA